MRSVKTFLPFVIVILLYAGLRLIHLEYMAHGDERHWVGRSLNFYRAIASGEFEFTYQKEHPGVMTMWAGTFGYIFGYPGILSNMEGNNPDAQTNILRMWDWGMHPPDVLVTLRATKVILQVVFFAVALRYLVPLIGTAATLLTGTLIALSTTIYGWDSWIHIDGLFAIAGFAGITVTAYAGERTRLFAHNTNYVRWLWFFAGVLCATSWLNRVIGLVLIGVVGLVLLIQLFAQWRSEAKGSPSFITGVRSAILHGSIWLAGAVVATFALFPALWVKPVETIRTIIDVPLASVRGDDHDIYVFQSLDDPGWLYYPTELFIRTTPFEWVGLFAIILSAYAIWKRKVFPRSTLRLVPVMFVFAAVFVIGLSLSSKKAPQYLTIIYPIIILIASVGLLSMGRLVSHKWPKAGMALAYPLLIGVISYSAVASYQALPYKNTYNNPQALRILDRTYAYTIRPGYPELAEFFVNLDPDPPMEIGFSSGGFDVIFPYHVPPELEPTLRSWINISSPEMWYSLDYQIVGVNYPADETHERYGVPPLYTLEVQGRVLWEVHPAEIVPPYRTALPQTACTTSFGDHVTLYQVDPTKGSIDLYLVSGDGAPITVEVHADTEEGQVFLGREDIIPSPPGTLVRASVDNPTTNSDDAASVIPLTITVYDTESGNEMAVTNGWTSDVTRQAEVATDCFTEPQPPSETMNMLETVQHN